MENGKLDILLIENDFPGINSTLELCNTFSGSTPNILKCNTLTDGLKKFKKNNYDVVLLDLDLQDSTGLQTLETACKVISKIPIIVLTNRHDKQIGIDAMKIGAQDFQVKGDTSSEQLYASIQYAISRKNIEDRLRKNQDLLLAIFNEAPISLFLVDQEHKVIKVNEAGLNYARRSEKETIGLKSGEALNCINSLDDPRGCGHGKRCSSCTLRNTINDTFNTKATIRNIETVLPHKQNGSVEYRNIIFTTSYIETEMEPYVQVSINDVTELKRSQIQIEKNNQRLETLLKINQFPSEKIQELLNFTLDMIIELTESKIGYIFFYDEKKNLLTLNASTKEVIDPPSNCKLEETGYWGEAVRQRKPIIMNNNILHHPLNNNAGVGPVELTKFMSIPVFQDQTIVAVVGIANKETDYNETDVKQLTLLMDSVWKKVARNKHNEELIIAKEKAEESDRLKSSFLATMSHELRTPLNSVIGFSDLIAEENDVAVIKEFGKNINDSGNHLLMIIEEIFSISELESVEVKFNKELFNIGDLFKSIDVEASKFEAVRQHNLNINLKINEKLKDYYIYADKSKIKQVFFHLISNAIKFTQKGEISYGISFVNNTPAFFVSDTGIGISDKHKEMIFERFIQVEQPLTREFDGIGLGLTICKRIIDLFNGKIWFTSELGKGTTFYFTFPDLIINIINPINPNDPFLK